MFAEEALLSSARQVRAFANLDRALGESGAGRGAGPSTRGAGQSTVPPPPPVPERSNRSTDRSRSPQRDRRPPLRRSDRRIELHPKRAARAPAEPLGEEYSEEEEEEEENREDPPVEVKREESHRRVPEPEKSTKKTKKSKEAEEEEARWAQTSASLQRKGSTIEKQSSSFEGIHSGAGLIGPFWVGAEDLDHLARFGRNGELSARTNRVKQRPGGSLLRRQKVGNTWLHSPNLRWHKSTIWSKQSFGLIAICQLAQLFVSVAAS